VTPVKAVPRDLLDDKDIHSPRWANMGSIVDPPIENFLEGEEGATDIIQVSRIVAEGTQIKIETEIEDAQVLVEKLYQNKVWNGGKVEQKAQILGDEARVDAALQITEASATASGVEIHSYDKGTLRVEQRSEIIGPRAIINAPVKIKGVKAVSSGISVMPPQRSHSSKGLPNNNLLEQNEIERLAKKNFW